MRDQGLFPGESGSGGLPEKAGVPGVRIPGQLVCGGADGLPAWMPESVAARLRRGEAFPVSFSRAEKKILRKRKKIAVSAWAEKHRYLTMSAIPGQWRNEVTPYLPGIMDAAAFSSVRVITVCKCPQSGVTEAVNNFVGAAIDQDPGPVLYTFPDKDTADENSRDRILPMIKSSKRLRGYLSGTRHDESMMRINLAHMPIYMSWASSPARLANKPIRYGVSDEVDKFAARGSKETGPLDQIDKRFTTYRDSYKWWRISTPTVERGLIWQAMTTDAEVIFYFWARCPECGRDQLMSDERIVSADPDETDPRAIRRKNLGRHACEHCDALWDDHQRNRAVALGQWRAQGPDDPLGLELFAYLTARRPMSIAFHLPAWVTRFNTLGYCLASKKEAETGDLDKKKNYANQVQALPHKQIVVETVASAYKTAECALPAQTAPSEAVALTCGIDCQKTGFYFLVRGWARDYTSWMIHYGRLGAWADIEEMLFYSTYPVAESSRRMAIARALIDTGGSKFNPDMSMTEEAYWWLRKNGVGRGARCWGSKGASWPQAHKVKVSKPIDKTPSGKAIPGGLQILTIDTEKFKDAFFWRLEQAVGGIGLSMAAWVHAGTGEDYWSHITAEHKIEDDKGVLQWVKKGSRRNDWLDCEIMAAAAADPEWPEGGVHLAAIPDETFRRGESRSDSEGRRDRRRDRADEMDEADEATGRDRVRGYEAPSWLRGR